MKAVGMYFRTLREGQGVTRSWVAEQTGTTETSLYRIEAGKQKPGLELMLGIIDALRGSVSDVRKLMGIGDNGEDVAKDLASQWLAAERQKQAGAHDFTNNFTADELSAIRAELASDPGFVDRILDATAREILRRQR